jgi:H/ACA ribonucleoprotein complex subunit 1
MARNFGDRRREQLSGETVELGKVMHTCQKQLVVSLVCTGVPYPNSPVLNSSKKVIGKIDEILGQLDDPCAAVALASEDGKYKRGEMLFAYIEKFIPKSRFLPREEVEKKKEARDLAKPKKERPKHRDGRSGGMRGSQGWSKSKGNGWGRRSNENFSNRRGQDRRR